MVKWKGVMKMSSKMRSKMERSDKNIRTKCNCISIYAQYKGQAFGERVFKVETPGKRF
jgi:hypothetical protein